MGSGGVRRDLVPSSALPLAYFGLAHAGLASALAVLAIRPELPGGFFHHPRMIALVHLVTIAWLSGSILGAFHIVAPLALRLPMPVRPADWTAFAAFAAGAAGMVAHFWLGTYDGMAWSASLVTAAIGWVGWRALRGMAASAAPWPVLLHVGLAFVNILAAAVIGILIGLDRSRGFLGWSPLGGTFAHAHLAAVGWVAMMVVGLAYRLIPMMLPAAMPVGRSLAASAILIEAGLVLLVITLIRGSDLAVGGALLILGGFGSFVVQIRRTLKRRMPRPPALPARDWSTWQTHAALVWLLVAAGLGLAASAGLPYELRVPAGWIYGVAGTIGFLAQIVIGMQGRLVPMYAWYRAFAAQGGAPPARGAHELPSAAFAKTIFATWTVGVPLLGPGLAFGWTPVVRVSALLLLTGVVVNAVYLARMLHAAAAGIPRRLNPNGMERPRPGAVEH